MCNQLLVLAFLSGVIISTFTQAAEPTPMRTFMDSKEIMGLIDTAKAERKGDAPLVSKSILMMAPYRAQLEYRPGTAPAALHEKNAELMVVVQWGGKLVDEKRVKANNLSGSSITGGNSQAVVVGDMLIVPANIPHQIIPTGGAPIVLMTMHVPDPPMACARSSDELAAGELEGYPRAGSLGAD